MDPALRLYMISIRHDRRLELRDTRSRPPVLASLAERPTPANVEMDPELWGTLQFYMNLEKVFAKLPLREFFQLRRVCKDWNRVASDEKFLLENAGPPIPKPYFCVAHPEGDWQIILTYNPSLQAWHQLPMSLPYEKGRPAKFIEGYLRIPFVQRRENDRVELKTFLLDIQTRMQHVLPPISITSDDEDSVEQVDGMFVNNRNGTFHVFAVIRDYLWQPYVYDSVSKRWNSIDGEGVHEMDFPNPSLSHGSVFCNDVLYMFTQESDRILAYDVVRHEWRSFRKPCQDAVCTHLGTWEGHVYAVVQVWLSDRPQRPCAQFALSVHKLCSLGQVWTEVDRVPEELREWLFKTNEGQASDEVKCNFTGTKVATSFCEQYAFVCSFLEDYNVTCIRSVTYNHRIWTEDNLVPRRFALYNLATKEWSRVNLPFKSERERIEIEGEWQRYYDFLP